MFSWSFPLKAIRGATQRAAVQHFYAIVQVLQQLALIWITIFMRYGTIRYPRHVLWYYTVPLSRGFYETTQGRPAPNAGRKFGGSPSYPYPRRCIFGVHATGVRRRQHAGDRDPRQGVEARSLRLIR